mmetsp:Transcript_23725/g.42428  ORF Transcript_23725/g.42428 Transcript_23725/m.42428 type:complete len:256 (-) Transcript_23725:406-1173(-)
MEESDPSEEEERSRCISGGMEREDSEWDDMSERRINCGNEEEDANEKTLERASSSTSSRGGRTGVLLEASSSSLPTFKSSLRSRRSDEAAAFALLAAMNSWNSRKLSNSSTVCALAALSPFETERLPYCDGGRWASGSGLVASATGTPVRASCASAKAFITIESTIERCVVALTGKLAGWLSSREGMDELLEDSPSDNSLSTCSTSTSSETTGSPFITCAFDGASSSLSAFLSLFIPSSGGMDESWEDTSKSSSS